MVSDLPVVDPAEAVPALLRLREQLEAALFRECARTYGERLLALAGYGSVARGKFGTLSDFDFILGLDPWQGEPRKRWEEFRPIERALEGEIAACHAGGWEVRLSPVFKSRAAIEFGSPLFLDMVEDGRILFDRDGLLVRRLDLMRARMRRLGSQRVWEGESWYWDLKPDWKPGDVIEL